MRWTKVLFASLLLFAVGCARNQEPESQKFEAKTSDPRVSHLNPVWLTTEDQKITVNESAPQGSQGTVIGFLKSTNAVLEKNQGLWNFSANLSLLDGEGNEIWKDHFNARPEVESFDGQWRSEGPSGLRVMGTCLETNAAGNCKGVVLDVFYTVNGQRHAVQLVAELESNNGFSFEQEKAALEAQQEASQSNDEVEGVDPEEYHSLYVGHLFGADPIQGVPGAKPADQVIGLPQRGSMQNSTSLKGILNGDLSRIDFVHPTREVFYGSQEMMGILQALAGKSKEMPRKGKLWVGDISRQKGGYVGNHKSHQNGLDVDVAYPTMRVPTGGFINIVKSGTVISDFQIQEAWDLFKTTWDSGSTDRIFVGSVVKRAFCKYAKVQKEYDSYGELLRRLRPTPGHDNHFHLRIKCTPNQPRCRMIGPPPSGTGC